MKRIIPVFAVMVVLAAALATQAGSTTVKLQFMNHLKMQFAEQDVYIERAAGSGQVFRVTASDKNMSAALYAAADPIKHNPFDAKDLGPYKKGRALGISLGQWLAASGSGTYSCANGQGRVNVAFRKLVPNGVYTMWYFFMALPPQQPFTGTLDLPMGARDGSQNTFRASAQGNATYQLSLKPCLDLSGQQVSSGLAIAWHSDGKTYKADPGPFGSVSHVQLFLLLPKASDVQP
jgi:hypothetical protein